MEFKCPRCGKVISDQNQPDKNAAEKDLPEFFPFCSERCKYIDLGAWMEEGYRIPVRDEEQDD
jgi:hypothetical protein